MSGNNTNNSLAISNSEHDVKRIVLLLNFQMQRAILPVILFIGIVTFVGTVGNILILLIYGRRREGGNFRCFVLMMAAIDLTSCITTLPGEIYSLLNWYDSPYIWICKAKTFFNVFTSWGSAWVLFLLAIDRYRKICRPLRWQIRTSLAMKLCVLFLIISAAVGIPVAIAWGKHTYEHTVNSIVSVNVSVCEKTDIVHKHKALLSVGFVFIVPVFITLFVLLCLNSITSITLFQQRTKFGKLTNAQKRSEPATVSKFVSVDTKSSSGSDGTQSTSSPVFADQTPESSQNVSVCRNITNKNPLCSIENIKVSFKRQGKSSVSEKNKSNAAVAQKTSKTSETNTSGLKSTTNREERFKIMKQKTVIMLVLTVTFVVTMLLYVVLISYKTNDALNAMPDDDKVLFFFFLRLYFVNTIVNPLVYGIMDVKFRNDIVNILKTIVPH
ncbi:hypothetical protein DPMN_167451 [Dreissena polymorpha]|uniref:G-protein coupled receptors family 1 profile domain-containing protein n=1 Tax=Dreissena polymorpha TaxID=45954 RepID=A0A9D4IV24_DREPO|nr:hypothetical protein DPMN_167451 [Dreissena polymorpha]